jgi:hypothetical protein
LSLVSGLATQLQNAPTSGTLTLLLWNPDGFLGRSNFLSYVSCLFEAFYNFMFRFSKMLARGLRMNCHCRADKPTKERNKEMKNNMIKYLASTALAVGIVGTVQAIPITGSIGFNGAYTQVDGTAGNLLTSTKLQITESTLAVTPGTPTGTFAIGTAGAPMSFAGTGLVAVNGAGSSTVSPSPMITQLWSVTVGSKVFNMTVLTEFEPFKSSTQINLTGTGTIHDASTSGTLLDDTAGTWQLGFGVSGTPPTASFTWQSTSAAGVPDGGTTVMLLGAALSGLAMLRRKLA